MSDPLIARKGPYAVDVEEGRPYLWCACGRARKQPYCDSSHAGTGILPVAYQAAKTETVYFCGCKHSKTPPLCDGSHNDLEDD